MGLTFGRCRDASGPLMDAAMALYRRSFPAHELRLWPDQQAVMNDPLYHFDLCLLDGALAGLILYWDFGAYIYVEHFCVEPSMRGHGLGTLILAELAKKSRPIILEIDPPEDEISVRRQHFYQRLGFVANPYAYIHPSFRRPFHPHRLVLMSYPEALTYEEARGFADFIRERVLRYSEHENPELPRL